MSILGTILGIGVAVLITVELLHMLGRLLIKWGEPTAPEQKSAFDRFGRPNKDV